MIYILIYILMGFITASIMALPCVTNYEMSWEEFCVMFVFWPVILPLTLLCWGCLLLEYWIKLLRKIK
jgi:hypothetical protein